MFVSFCDLHNHPQTAGMSATAAEARFLAWRRMRTAVPGGRVSFPIVIVGKVASMQTFALPPAIAQLVLARNAVRDHYRRILTREGSDVDLAFTLDGNLIGDIGEAIAVELFGVKLVTARSAQGIDGHAPDGRSVQVKVTGTRRGPAFRCSETKADHLLFLDLNVETATGTVMFNGPEHLVTKYLPEFFDNPRMVSRRQIIDADRLVLPADRLPILVGSNPQNPGDLRPPSNFT